LHEVMLGNWKIKSSWHNYNYLKYLRADLRLVRNARP